MAKQVTQETFDDVVRENMTEFDMSAEEAVEDAVSQFEAQGVNLAMVIKDPNLYGNSGAANVHPVIEAIEALDKDLESEITDDIITTHLQRVASECELDLSRRILAGKNNAFQVLLKVLKLFISSSRAELQKQTLVSLCSLCNGQPDLISGEGVSVLIQTLEHQTADEGIIERTIKLIRLNCIKHEGNRNAFVEAGLIQLLVKVLAVHKKSPTVVKEVSFALRVLTYDDDIRVPFGSAHEHAKMIVIEGTALKTLLDICKDYTDDKGVQGELFSTLAKLVVRNEFCKDVMDLGGLDLIMKSLQTNIKEKGIVRQALGLLQALAGNDDIKDAIVAAGGVELILSAMTHHQGNPGVSELGCKTLATLVLRKPEHSKLVIGNSGHHVILQAMKVHQDSETVQKQGCMSVRNIVARNRELCDSFLQLGAEELIKLAGKHKDCEDEAKAALRDLGCQVDLKIMWKGERGTLAQ